MVEDIERASRDFYNSVRLERELSDQGIPLFATDESADITGVSLTTILVRRVKQGGLFTVGELASIRRVDVNGGSFIARIGLPHSNLTKTSRLTCILPLDFPGRILWTSAR